MQTGDEVVSLWNLTDYDGSPFNEGESGVIVKTTRSTVHVRDPRGHVHIRYRLDFKEQ